MNFARDNTDGLATRMDSIAVGEEQADFIDEGLYSRQLYVLGHDAMRRMTRASVLVVGLRGLGLEVAKDVILAGVRSVALYDPAPVAVRDLGAGFFLDAGDAGSRRDAAARGRLAALNEYVPVRVLHPEDAPGAMRVLDAGALSEFRVVVLADQSLETRLAVADAVSGADTALVTANADGLFAAVFCDFGRRFVVGDATGEQPVTGVVTGIVQEEYASGTGASGRTPLLAADACASADLPPPVLTLTCGEDARHGLEDGDAVVLRDVRGALGALVNGAGPFRVRATSPYTFRVVLEAVGGAGDADAGGRDSAGSANDRLAAYRGRALPPAEAGTGGTYEQVKQPAVVSFLPLRESLLSPSFVPSDWAKIDRQESILLGVDALSVMAARACSLSDALSSLCTSGVHPAERVAHADGRLLAEMARQAGCVLAPMAAYVGGLVAQEALKACSGKFMPIRQHYVFDALECLSECAAGCSGSTTCASAGCSGTNTTCPTTERGTNTTTCASSGCGNTTQCDSGSKCNQDLKSVLLPSIDAGDRYAEQRQVFGEGAQARLHALCGFVVGAGAIGCELLKVFALMGLADEAAGAGVLHVTDMDAIEKSNLNRQFLFRAGDVGSHKSATAAAAVRSLVNPGTRVVARIDRVGPETEAVFGDAFFSTLDFVANALDNMAARRYVDGRCVRYGKPLLESGTLGTKGNTQVVLPGLTEAYSSSQDPPEATIPFCTLHNFPHAIEHTVQWAMDLFHGAFRTDAESANAYVADAPAFVASLASSGGQRDRVERVLRALALERPASFADCVAWARLRFQDLFHNAIAQLLASFPRDALTSTGTPFWSGHKRAPTPLVFSADDPMHLDFVVCAANLRAEMYGLSGSRDADAVRAVLAGVVVPPFVPALPSAGGASVPATPALDAPAEAKRDDGDSIDELVAALPAPGSLAGLRLAPIDFEKDDDRNMHVDFVAAAANLRARNYDIPVAARHAVKQIAGKIIPAIATTTAAVAGLVGLELYKVAAGVTAIDAYKNGFVNLALPLTAFSTPIAAPRFSFARAGRALSDASVAQNSLVRLAGTSVACDGASFFWTLWDRFEVRGDPTLGALIDALAADYGLSATMLTHGSSMLFGFMRSAEVLAQRRATPVSDLVAHVSKKERADLGIPPRGAGGSLVLDVLAEDADGNDVEVPSILVLLP